MIVLGAALLLAGCGHAAPQSAAKPAPTTDPEIRSQAGLARLHAISTVSP